MLRPLATRGDRYRSVLIPSYNGARKQPNLTPLLALLLARGTGGAAADTRRQVQVDWLHDQVCETLVDAERASPEAPVVELPDALDAATAA